jgi:hypothetical protein
MRKSLGGVKSVRHICGNQHDRLRRPFERFAPPDGQRDGPGQRQREGIERPWSDRCDPTL